VMRGKAANHCGKTAFFAPFAIMICREYKEKDTARLLLY